MSGSKREQRRNQVIGQGAATQTIPEASLLELDLALFGDIPELAGSAIAQMSNGEVQIGSFRLTAAGLVVAEGATHEEWGNVGLVLRRLEGSLQWLFGDWCNIGEDAWGEKYEAIAESTGYNPKSLREYAYVARQYDLSMRMDKLSFYHHQVIAGRDDRLEWLRRAADGGWSVARMRKEMEGNGDPTPTKDPFTRFATSQLKEAKKLDRPALATRVSQLRELLIQLEKVLEHKR